MVRINIDLGTLTNSCFVIMPFTATFNTEYERVIKPAVEAAGLACVRADEIFSKPQIMADIWKSIKSARVVIAELTGRNTNVFYELGLAHTIGKPAIILTRNEDDVPFDLKALRYISYNTEDPFWGENLRKSLTEMIKKLVAEQEYGNVLEGITLQGKIEYQEMKIIAPRKDKPSYNLTGFWQGRMKVKGTSYHCELQLIQKQQNLSGTIKVSWTTKREEKQIPSVVQEVIAGETEDNRVSFYGVSYSFLEQGTSSSYLLDMFSAEISPDGNELSGEVNDVMGNKGTFSFKREIVE